MTGSIRFIFIIFEEHSFQLLVKERKYQQYQAQNDKHNDLTDSRHCPQIIKYKFISPSESVSAERFQKLKD